MVTICHPRDDLEQVFIVVALERARIPYFVVGQYIGGILPGMQIPWYNERSIRGPAAAVESATEVVAEVRSYYVAPSDDLGVKSKIRMLLEGVVCGWVMPGGKKKGAT
jgi:hypothetical protein